jgi:methylenetetrahydrofolate reductase (NADPH)
LIDYINEEYDNYFEIEVGAYPETHPEAVSPDHDLKYFCEKMSREVQGAVTQFFFDTDVYFRFVENCKKLGCDKPITAGIMPISNKDALIRMANNCGAKLPDSLIKQLDSYSEEEDIKKFGVDYVSSLVQELIKKGAPGIHFYTINQLEPTKLILDNLD